MATDRFSAGSTVGAYGGNALNLLQRYRRLTLWNKLAAWGALASLLSLAGFGTSVLVTALFRYTQGSRAEAGTVLEFNGIYQAAPERGLFVNIDGIFLEIPTHLYLRFYPDGQVVVVEDPKVGDGFGDQYLALVMNRDIYTDTMNGGQGQGLARWVEDPTPQKFGIGGPTLMLEFPGAPSILLYASVGFRSLSLYRFLGEGGRKGRVFVPVGEAHFRRLDFASPSPP